MSTSTQLESNGYLYMLVEREFLRGRVCKIGRTLDMVQRFRHYPKGSKLLAVVFSRDHVVAEGQLIALFTKEYTQRVDIGREYFEGPLFKMLASFTDFMTELSRNSQNLDIEGHEVQGVEKVQSVVKVEKVAVDADKAIIEFMRDSEDLSSLPSVDLYTRFLDFVESKNFKVSVGHEKFSKALCSMYGAKSEVVRDDQGLRRYLVFPSRHTESKNVEKIAEYADPRIPKALEFIDSRIDFHPTRSAAYAGKTFFAWITTKDLLVHFWEWYTNDGNVENREFQRSLERNQNDKKTWKSILKKAMASRGREDRTIRTTLGDKAIEQIAFDRVKWLDPQNLDEK